MHKGHSNAASDKDPMDPFWQERAFSYGAAQDLETKVRATIAQEVAQAALPHDHVLELGCGNGVFLKQLLDRRQDLDIEGVDSSAAMVAEAQKRLPGLTIRCEKLETRLHQKSGHNPRFIVLCNTLHNLSSPKAMHEVLERSAELLPQGGRLLLDIRNGLNPFVEKGYFQNRKKGLQFFTMTPWEVSSQLAKAGLVIEKRIPMHYDSLQEAGKHFKNPVKRFLYSIYLKMTRYWLFAPYYVVSAVKPQPEFVSIIWGYHKQFYGFSKVQNYQLEPLLLAKEKGYRPIAYMIDARVKISDDPNYRPGIEVAEHRDTPHMIAFLWRHRNALVYANSVIWQNLLLVPLLCRKAIFMAHDSIARRSKLKQFIENLALHGYWRIRVIAPGEKEFLVREGISPEKIFIAPIALDVALFKPAALPGKDIVYVGNVTPDNDIATILRAVLLARAQFPEIKLHIIGEVRVPEFHALVRQLGLKEAVVEHGFVPHQELADILPKFAIFVSSVISSGQHLSVFEAALSGLALCLPDTMQFNTVFKGAAQFHSLYSADQLATNILAYLADPKTAQRDNEKARALIMRGYTKEVTQQKLIELFSF